METGAIEVPVQLEFKVCAMCGKHLARSRVDRQTCSDLCRRNLSNWRKRQRALPEALRFALDETIEALEANIYPDLMIGALADAYLKIYERAKGFGVGTAIRKEIVRLAHPVKHDAQEMVALLDTFDDVSNAPF